MNDSNDIKKPTKKEKITLRLLIVIGTLSFCNFFYWFLKPDLIETPFLFWILTAVIVFDSLRILYIWIHYWAISIPKKPVLKSSFTVDVLTTYFPGEPYAMTTQTLLAIKNIRYPHNTYLCDEANDPFLKNFCQKHGIIHVTRNNRINAKAGNINNALLQATGEICLILDPDHVPKPDFLDEVLPYFENKNIGFVQTAQVYYNVKESDVAEGASQQTFHFYGPMMMSMNSYGTVNAIGANCVFRRKALDSIGGHAPGLSEDMHTAMQLHAKGWKSVYVPKAFTEGLTPASLTAYYKQQLKWSRGTLELLVSVYPKLFKKFTWKQKFHYGLLPMHYLSGIFFLLGFLIPIISLFNASLPWKGNVINFGLIYLPVLVSIFCIRIFVQRWVLNKSERGIHILGGLLLICTWWVFLLGFVYTVIRKNVPYLPTPKDDKELTNFKILIPNLVIAVISIAAIIYGLNLDFTPFSLFMSGFALFNVLIMLYTLVFAYQKPREVKLNLNEKPYSNPFRNSLFIIFRKTVLPLVLSSVIICGGIQYYGEYVKWGGVTSEIKSRNTINYIGVFAPKIDNGLTDLNTVKTNTKFGNHKFDLISLYLPWHKNIESNFPKTLIDSIYKQNSIPVITWEPWINTFEGDFNSENHHVYNLIETGYFDNYIADFANTLKTYKHPVFLRFAHEFDNPFYPWYVTGDKASEKFKNAWIHTYEIFKKQGADNVVWIWNPWKPEHVASFYPGEAYVDWIGVNILNYGDLNQDGKSQEFEALYKPFHDAFKNLPGTPVVISEFGALTSNLQKNVSNWQDNAFIAIENNFPEIKSIIHFNSKVDNNWPTGEIPNTYLDWTIASKQTTLNLFEQKKVPSYINRPLQDIKSNSLPPEKAQIAMQNIKGINFKIGHNWEKDYHILNRRKLIADFENIKNLKLNTLKYQGNSVYDHNVFEVSKLYNLNIAYSFWVPENLDFMTDTLKTEALKSEIIKTVKALKNNDHIISWHIENDVQHQQKNFYHKPELLYQNRAYILWLKELSNAIKKEDNKRPLITNIEINQQSIYHIKNILNSSAAIDGIGLVVKNDENLENVVHYLSENKTHFILSDIDAANLKPNNILKHQFSFFITGWQDKHESNKLVFDGLIDRKGRQKKSYLEAISAINSKPVSVELPKIKILKPSKLIYENNTHTYYAMIYSDSWIYGSDSENLEFEWALIKCDEFGNYLAIKEKGFGPSLQLKIPENHDLYRLQLTAIKSGYTTTTITTLNTPLLD
ncbi:glycosyltransferase [Algibacter miyuki]|uniref:Glycosyltransferase n=1 Tax=Algibacter miyuki TaxID=1306933 RepID=A0ABV5GZ42_9FLAO|nr:glycosyltransferase [Algibacter miyuki]MDN3666878.1 glycosyltransferase [Algibacter miyuki]